ncbi:Cnl2/NKP2 family protein-domain-containing protein [Cryomyces antarcticus]|nr:hypothetical protein LTR04_001939 [Oleoguttula sp. CCFEE 6159]
MPHTEASILSNFLLPPAPLPAALSLRKFTELFPRSHQDNPQIEVFYRDLHYQRAIQVDAVEQNVAAEVKRGKKQKQEVIKARRAAEAPELSSTDVREIRMEAELFGPSLNPLKSKPHDIHSIRAAIAAASEDIEAELAALEGEAASILADVKTTIGDLSDLRYGRFSNPAGARRELGQEVLEGLQRVEAVCQELNGG